MKTKSRRKTFNRIVKLLASMYDINYNVVMYYYNHYDKNVTLVKYKLKLINEAGHQLEIIN